MDLAGWGSSEDLGGVEKAIRIYCMKKKLLSIKKLKIIKGKMVIAFAQMEVE